jgi:hypothetical protein
VIQEIFGVADEFAFGVERETVVEGLGRTLVQSTNVEVRS